MAMPLPQAWADSSLNDISLEYSFAELQQATRNFDAANKLGNGSFGGVFRGVQRDGTEVAIKVLDIPEEAGFDEEVRVLSKFRHPNLVILMGFARNESRRCLVYELLGGGDVYRRLQKSSIEGQLYSWNQRVSTAFDAACGLSHLHHASPKVFHRDIKSPNILLDRNGTAKMADFGLACLSHGVTQRVKQASGTVGYACPLYVQRGVVTEGSEVYSFGIVLLELLTASPPAVLSQAPDGSQQYQFMVTHIGGSISVVMSMADPKAQWPLHVQCAIADLGLRCTQMVEELRPGFAEIVSALRTLRDQPEASAMTVPGTMAMGVGVGNHGHGAAAPAVNLHNAMLAGAGAGVCGAGVSNARPIGQIGWNSLQGKGGQIVAGADVAGGLTPQAAAQHSPPEAPGPMLLRQPSVGWGAGAAAAQNFATGPAPQHFLQAGPAGPALAGPAPAVDPAPAIVAPTLWSLVCVRSDGVSADMLANEQCRLTHRHEFGGPLLTTLRVGRLFQEDLFTAIVPEEDARGAVSREHFQIWADEMPMPGGPSPAGGIPCYFFLTNYSVNGTIVNGKHLHARGEQAELHSGDIIAFARLSSTADGLVLAPFLEFRFDLTGSVLTDADAFAMDDRAAVASSAVPLMTVAMGRSAAAPLRQLPLKHAVTPTSAMQNAAADLAFMPQEGLGSCIGACTSFVGTTLEPLFVLEAGGTALRGNLLAEHRRIVHGPPMCVGSTDAVPCPPLLLGRGQQQAFWFRLLIDEAFNALSRQHLVIEASTESASSTSFTVRNLSDRNPIRVCGSLDERPIESVRAFERHELRPLAHGDVIVVNPNRGSTLWLVFRDLAVNGGLTAVRDGTPCVTTARATEAKRFEDMAQSEQPPNGVAVSPTRAVAGG